MAKHIQINTNFLNEDEENLIHQICTYFSVTKIHVSPFTRFGNSGAHLLLAFFSDKPDGKPYLIKICKNTKSEPDAEREHAATTRLQLLIGESEIVGGVMFKSGDWGAFILKNRGSETNSYAARSPLSFRNIMYHYGKLRDFKERIETPSINRMIIEEKLKGAFSKLREAHSKFERLKRNLRIVYSPYFRDYGGTKRIRQVLSSQNNKASFTFLGKKILNPALFLNDLPREYEFCVGPVHGDLHPDNIILDANLNIWLIDFAWGHPTRDILVDYVLMENSIRFWHFPSKPNLNIQGDIDSLLLDEDGCSLALSYRFNHCDNVRAFHRQAKLVRVIRNCARETLGDCFQMRDYLLAQFIVLYGLVKFDSYDPYITTRALGMIAQRLSKLL